MVVRTGLLFLILVTAPVQVFAVNPDKELLRAVQGCVVLLDDRETDASSAVNVFCPQLEEQLRNSFLGSVSVDDRFTILTYGELQDIQNVMVAKLNPTPSRVSISFADLDQILSDTLVVDASAKNKLGWWNKFLAWLEEKLRKKNDVDLKWLEDILKALSFSEETRKFIMYGSFATIILLALIIVTNELKAGGLYRRRTRTKRSADVLTSAALGNTSSELLTPDSIRKLPQQVQPQALLSSCINHFIRSGKLPDDRSRTNREFLKLFGNSNNQNAVQSFRELVERAERSVYGGEQLSSEVLSECFDESRRLLGTPATL